MTTWLTPEQSAALAARLRSRFEALREEVRQDLLKSDDDRAAGLADRVRDLEDESLATLIMDLDLADTDAEMLNLKAIREAADRRALRAALARADGNVTIAARLLGISRPTFYDLARQYGLETTER